MSASVVMSLLVGAVFGLVVTLAWTRVELAALRRRVIRTDVKAELALEEVALASVANDMGVTTTRARKARDEMRAERGRSAN